jgi:hypothetical protein
VAGNDPAVLSDQNRIVEAEMSDAVGDLPDLLLGMDARIAGIRAKARDRHRFDRHGLHGFSSSRIVS